MADRKRLNVPLPVALIIAIKRLAGREMKLYVIVEQLLKEALAARAKG